MLNPWNGTFHPLHLQAKRIFSARQSAEERTLASTIAPKRDAHRKVRSLLPPVSVSICTLIAGRVKSIELYEEANLPTQVLSNIRRAHFEEPTPIQRYALPCIQQRDDLMACAQTGSGKTVGDDALISHRDDTNTIAGCLPLAHHLKLVAIPRR